MTQLGYKLICEEHGPTDLTQYATLADQSAFEFAMISDHFHPWTSTQGESPFVWNVIGAIAQATDDLRLGTSITCPIIRYHPGLIAQAAATAGVQLPGQFFLGVGTGENLSEHVFGDRWPPHAIRLEMLREAVDLIRTLWEGETTSYRGEYYTVENARLYTLPDELPPIPIAADGPKTARAAGEIGNGLVAVAPDEELVEAFEDGGGEDKPRYAEVDVCYAEDEQEAIETAHEIWPQAALPGELLWELATPAHFQQATEVVSEEDIADLVVCGPDPDAHIETIQEYVDAGFDHITIHQIGSNQAEFVEFYEEEVIPEIE
ncbi:putative F420-dependent oxidoreductase [Natrialba magadii ATCC 43099]|uniref:F420-dependent oxidoreductase n=1 Tax=Natrialba magadii (strain ATCC 43099 / DSM 3394 / CCM 3739 / CIP 104546 / IAM 13178 / JCM 8861 / NBRC 102185 / NCIMB 2190 / MS3) TaxID=547559 RepID=D3SRM1_NATMM|nr:TIGR03557 family F420-dependent LLM class oxidoreductase [Natrialba magadii]ADD04726.1 putative F420-dependent oxidoreductase [Natrialba magadii ATCC 43099]ELY24893.1 G6PDH family F420-dependent oxidoreductase [Natrialba magadii ATCC 43099]